MITLCKNKQRTFKCIGMVYRKALPRNVGDIIGEITQ